MLCVYSMEIYYFLIVRKGIRTTRRWSPQALFSLETRCETCWYFVFVWEVLCSCSAEY